MRSLASYKTDLHSKVTTSRRLVEDALQRAMDPGGEGNRVFTRIYEESARACATASDQLRAFGIEAGPLSGIPISIKDLFDVAGEPTNAGSVLFSDGPNATSDSVVVRKLRMAGAVLTGRTNMTEFAFSGLGLNPHYGTPRNPYDRATGRIPGGSTSGGAVSVTDGMAAAAIGSDTGGSVRIPAALCGLTGFKPTASRISRDGVLPLSTTLDAVGVIAPTVGCCALLDSVLADNPVDVDGLPSLRGVKIGVLNGYVLDGLDKDVAANLAAVITVLSNMGAMVEDIDVPSLAEIPQCNAKGGFPAPESYAWHRDLLARFGERYDPRVSTRIARGKDVSAADHIQLIHARERVIKEFGHSIRSFDAILMPTVPRIAPTIASLAIPNDEAYFEVNGAMLRNPSVVNFINGCALSIPCHKPGDAPVGVTFFGPAHADSRLLSLGIAIERALASAGCAINGGDVS